MTSPAPSNTRPEVVWHQQTVTRQMREQRLGQRGCVVWFTGLSGCGKSTIANELDRLLFERRCVTTLLDGDNVRHHLCAGYDRLVDEHGEAFARRFGLGFEAIDRQENIRRIGGVCELFASTGVIVLATFVSPYRKDRQRVRQLIESLGQPGDFVEVFVDTPLEVCQQRDPKGLYKKVAAGEIKNFTGISDPYEAPQSPELRVETHNRAPAQVAQQIASYLESVNLIAPENAKP